MSDTLNRPHLTGEQVVLTGLGQEMHPAFAPFEQKSVAFSGKLPPDQLVSFSNPQCVTHEAPRSVLMLPSWWVSDSSLFYCSVDLSVTRSIDREWQLVNNIERTILRRGGHFLREKSLHEHSVTEADQQEERGEILFWGGWREGRRAG